MKHSLMCLLSKEDMLSYVLQLTKPVFNNASLTGGTIFRGGFIFREYFWEPERECGAECVCVCADEGMSGFYRPRGRRVFTACTTQKHAAADFS